MTRAVLPENHSPSDLDRLEGMRTVETAVHACQRCSLAAGRTRAVPGEGNLNTVVMFVGEGPGFEEDKQGRPFVGRSGQFLTEMLRKVGIERSDVYITNVVKCRPPDNRDPLPEELAACAAYLERQVALINPRIIVTLGRFSMRRWFPDGSITQLHGQVRNIGQGRVAMAMFHPAAALRNPQWQVDFAQDIQILPKLMERAQRANAAAARGEGLPAGVPHPGDPDYVAPPSLPTPVATVNGVTAPLPSAPPAPDVVPKAAPDDAGDLAQLSLF